MRHFELHPVVGDLKTKNNGNFASKY